VNKGHGECFNAILENWFPKIIGFEFFYLFIFCLWSQLNLSNSNTHPSGAHGRQGNLTHQSSEQKIMGSL